METKFVAIVNQKGGVGKTTTAVNFAALAARMLGPDSVLLVDIDSQANSSVLFLGPAIPFDERSPDILTLLDVLEGRCSLADAAHVVSLDSVAKYPASTLHVVSARIELAALETQLNTGYKNLFTLKDKAKSVTGRYKVVILDCPANFGGFMVNALMMSQYLIVPVIPGQYEFVGLRSLMETIESIQQANPQLHVAGVLPSRIKRTKLARDAIANLEAFFGKELIMPPIADRVAVEEAHTAQRDVAAYKPKSDSAEQYVDAVQDFLARIGLEATTHV